MGWFGTKTDEDVKKDKQGMEDAKKRLKEKADAMDKESILYRGERSPVLNDYPEHNKGSLKK